MRILYKGFWSDGLKPRAMRGSGFRSLGGRNAQQGIALLISLLVLVLVTLSAAAMMRSLDSNVLAVGNLSFRQAAEAPVAQAIEAAMVNVAGSVDRPLLEGDLAANNYFSFIQPGEDADGIPAVLQGRVVGGLFGSYPAGFQSWTDTAGNTVRYVVERMCRTSGSWTPENCIRTLTTIDLSKIGTTSDLPHVIGIVPAAPGGYYRVTVRVDGPAG
ncbi:MAG: hypothetical protein LBE15_00205, partial [Burkholderiales bacterium]|nr:hypothetical protein [Burkholderiales bacterium]